MGFIDFLKIIVFGIVEGFTEWLPVSSTGHLLVLNSLLNLNVSDQFMNVFLISIQLGAMLAVVTLYWKKLWPLTHDTDNYNLNVPVVALWIKIFIACVPAIIVGLLLNGFIDKLFFDKNYSPFIVGFLLIVYGGIYIYVENKRKGIMPKYTRIAKMPLKVVAYIGLFQLLAIIPGTSRPGATILGAMLLGCSRAAALEFTLYLGVPVIFGASLLKICTYVKKYGAFTGEEVVMILTGCIVTYLVSIFVIRSVLGFVKNHDFKIFGYYRIVFGFVVILFFIIV